MDLGPAEAVHESRLRVAEQQLRPFGVGQAEVAGVVACTKRCFGDLLAGHLQGLKGMARVAPAGTPSKVLKQLQVGFCLLPPELLGRVQLSRLRELRWKATADASVQVPGSGSVFPRIRSYCAGVTSMTRSSCSIPVPMSTP